MKKMIFLSNSTCININKDIYVYSQNNYYENYKHKNSKFSFPDLKANTIKYLAMKRTFC